MSLTMTLGDLLTAEGTLLELAKTKRPQKTVYRLARVLKAVQVETKHFSDQREALIEELAEEREATPDELQRGSAPKVTAVAPTHMKEFVKRVKELQEVEATLETSFRVTGDLFNDDGLSAQEVVSLGPLFTMPEE